MESSGCLYFHGTTKEGETVMRLYPACIAVISMGHLRPQVKSLL